MKLMDEAIKKKLESGGYVRRTGWNEPEAVYRLSYGCLEFGFLHNGEFEELDAEERLSIEYDELFREDWVIV